MIEGSCGYIAMGLDLSWRTVRYLSYRKAIAWHFARSRSKSMGKPVWETLFTPHGLSKYKDADKFFLFVVTNL